MENRDTTSGACGASEILEHLASEDLLQLQPGERLWKLFCFRENAHPTGLRHRIYTKRKPDGRLALITFAVHNPRLEGGANGHSHGAPGPAVRSAIARVPDLAPGDLDRLIEAMRGQVVTAPCEALDLSDYPSLNEQFAWLEQRLDAEGGRHVFEPGGN